MTKDIDYWKNKAETLEDVFRQDSLYLKIREVFKTTPQLAAVIKLFVQKEFVSHEAIITVAEEFGSKTEPSQHYSKVVMWRLRKDLPPDIIINTLRSDGYKMESDSRKKLLELLT